MSTSLGGHLLNSAQPRFELIQYFFFEVVPESASSEETVSAGGALFESYVGIVNLPIPLRAGDAVDLIVTGANKFMMYVNDHGSYEFTQFLFLELIEPDAKTPGTEGEVGIHDLYRFLLMPLFRIQNWLFM